jgi:hypothetical protein
MTHDPAAQCKTRFWAGLGDAFGRIAALCVCLFTILVPAQAENDQIKKFLSVNGCVIGPATRDLAVSQNIDRKTFEAYVTALRTQPGTVKNGDWLLLSSELCAILPPVITSAININDPEVAGSLSPINAYTNEWAKGCFLDSGKLVEALGKSRNWSLDKVHQEYWRFLGASIVAGDLSFYSVDPLRTPPGFIATGGACANTPEMTDIKHNHALLIKHFGAMVRKDAAGEAICELGAAPTWKMTQIIGELTGKQATNAYMHFEVMMIALGAGWYEDATQTRKPRPPLCRYGDAGAGP